MEFWKNIKLKLKYKNIIKKCFWIISLIFLLLYLIAFVMKDYANNNNVKKICQEFVNGPRNIIALVINKISPQIMDYKTNIIIEEKNNSVESLADSSLKYIVKQINKQKEIDNQLNKELESGTYTFDDPLIIQDPYNMSPLTALILYTSEKPELVSITIGGKDKKSEIQYTFNKQGYEKKHIIPVMGLYADADNKVNMKSIDVDGNIKNKEISIKTDKIKNELENISFSIYKGDSELYQDGLNFSYSSIDQKGIKMAFDINGDIRWYFDNLAIMTGNFNKGKSIFIIYGNEWFGDSIICEMNYLGKILNMYYYPNGVHHDLYLTDHNTMILTGNHENTFEDLLTEINLDNNNILYNIDYRNLFPRGRKQVWGYNGNTPQDWMHMNSVVEYNGDVIVSSNFQSAIMRNSKEGKIKWILADPRDFTTYWQQYLLKPIGEDFEYPYNQHAVEILPDYDHNPDTIDVLLFDNGSSRFLVDEELQKNIKLGTFNRDFGIYKNSIYIELTSNKDIIWECYATSNLTSNNYFDYRLERLPIYNDDNDYMDIEKEMNNFAPMEVLKKYGYQN